MEKLRESGASFFLSHFFLGKDEKSLAAMLSKTVRFLSSRFAECSPPIGFSASFSASHQAHARTNPPEINANPHPAKTKNTITKNSGRQCCCTRARRAPLPHPFAGGPRQPRSRRRPSSRREHGGLPRPRGSGKERRALFPRRREWSESSRASSKWALNVLSLFSTSTPLSTQ